MMLYNFCKTAKVIYEKIKKLDCHNEVYKSKKQR